MTLLATHDLKMATKHTNTFTSAVEKRGDPSCSASFHNCHATENWCGQYRAHLPCCSRQLEDHQDKIWKTLIVSPPKSQSMAPGLKTHLHWNKSAKRLSNLERKILWRNHRREAVFQLGKSTVFKGLPKHISHLHHSKSQVTVFKRSPGCSMNLFCSFCVPANEQSKTFSTH